MFRNMKQEFADQHTRPNGGFVIYVPELPGLATEAATRERRSRCSATTHSPPTWRACACTDDHALCGTPPNAPGGLAFQPGGP